MHSDIATVFTRNVVLVISCLGVAQAILLCVYLFTLRDKKASMFLALVLLGLTIRIGKSVIHHYFPLDPWIRNVGLSGILMTGPFLWFYGKALFEKNTITTRHYLHLVPFVVFAIFFWAIPNRGDVPSKIVYVVLCLHLAIYLGLCWKEITINRGARLLPWYRYSVIGVTLVWTLYVGIFAGLVPFYILGAVFFSFLIYTFSYLLLKRHVFALEKYSSSAIDKPASGKLLQQVKDLFEKNELYLDSTLTLQAVAERLAMNPREISQAINENEQKNFSAFVNQYRITRAKTLLADASYGDAKIETIAYDCGFGNVTSFNLAFKAETRMTPSQYRTQCAA